MSKHTADGWVSNTSQEDPPDSTTPAPLELLDSTTPHQLLLMGAQLHWLSCTAASRVNKNCCSLQGKEDKSRKDVGVFVPAKIVSFHCSDLRLELLLQKSTSPRSGGESTQHGAHHSSSGQEVLFMAERLRNFISHRAGQARHWHRSLHLT